MASGFGLKRGEKGQIRLSKIALISENLRRLPAKKKGIFMRIFILILGFVFVRWCFQSSAENLSIASGFVVLLGASVASILAILVFKWAFELLDSPAGYQTFSDKLEP
jgi:hypothetical protein